MMGYLIKEFRDIEELELHPSSELDMKKDAFESYIKSNQLLRRVVDGKEKLTDYIPFIRALKSKSFVPNTVDSKLKESLSDLERLLGPLFMETHDTLLNNGLSYSLMEMAFVPVAVLMHDANKGALDRRTFLKAGIGALSGLAAGGLVGSLASGLKYAAYNSRENSAMQLQNFAEQHYKKK